MSLPHMIEARTRTNQPVLDDPLAVIRRELKAKGLAERVQPGQTIAVTAGSRGIANMPLIVRILADWVKSKGATPVVIPAMGSHGGATAEGQLEMLMGMGFTPEVTGCEIVSSLDVTELGQLQTGPVSHHRDRRVVGELLVVEREREPQEQRDRDDVHQNEEEYASGPVHAGLNAR